MEKPSETATSAGHASNQCEPTEPCVSAASMGLTMWQQVNATDPQYTKAFNTSGFQGTSISPTYQSMRATKIFGPHGIGWGTEVLNESYVEGAPLGFDKDGRSLGRESIHKVYLELWYIYQGRRGSVKQYGATTFVFRNDYGTITSDEDHAKKSVTDAMTKCLSLLGFSADVFMGHFDDDKYVAGLRAKMANEASGGSTALAQNNETPKESAPQDLGARYLGYKNRLADLEAKNQKVGDIPAVRAQIQQDPALTKMEQQTLLQSPLLRIAESSQQADNASQASNPPKEEIFI